MHVETINAAYAFLRTPEGRDLTRSCGTQTALAARYRARRPTLTMCLAKESNLVPLAEFMATRDALRITRERMFE